MKKFLTVLSILMIFIVLGCQQPVGNSGDTYITNTINIVWQGSFENPLTILKLDGHITTHQNECHLFGMAKNGK